MLQKERERVAKNKIFLIASALYSRIRNFDLVSSVLLIKNHQELFRDKIELLLLYLPLP